MGKSGSSGGSAAIRAQSVVLEGIRSQMAVVVESTITTREELRREIRDLGSNLSARIDRLEAAVKQNSTEIRALEVRISKLEERVSHLEQRMASLEERVASLDERVASLEAEVAQVRRDLNTMRQRIERHDWEALERRVAAVESRLGITPGR